MVYIRLLNNVCHRQKFLEEERKINAKAVRCLADLSWPTQVLQNRNGQV